VEDNKMNYKFNIHGISCKSCIEKISSLLTNKLNATNIKFGINNTIMEFESLVATNVGQLNSLLQTIGDYKVSQFDNNITTSIHTHTKEEKPSYKPIYIIFAYLIAINIMISAKAMQLTEFMPNFMASFFLVFSFFKLLDLEGFAGGYSSYDIIARKFYHYGYIYPFLELGFGVTYLLIPHDLYFNLIVLVVMLVSSIGVIKAKISKQQFYCACVGTFLKVPLGSVAIIEDLLMTGMALAMVLQILL
jgi:hypothetical protein